MSIIKCSECGHDVSTLASCCQNCGCPVSAIVANLTIRQNKKYDVVLKQVGANEPIIVRFIREVNLLDLTAAFNIVDNLPGTIVRGVSFDLANTVVEKLSSIGGTAEAVESQSTENATDESAITGSYLFIKDKPICCPRCASNAVTTGTRGYSPIWGFLGSNKTTNRCGKCGFTWNP